VSPNTNVETTVTVALNTVAHIAQRVAREVAAQHPKLDESIQADITNQTVPLVVQVYCAELVAARLRQAELAVYDSVMSVASRLKVLGERLP
jgi:hypothetical protein